MIEEDIKSIYKILEKYNLSTKTFCLAPYLHYDFDQSGEMHSCFEGKKKMGNWMEQSALDQYNSKDYQNLRQWHRTGNKAMSTPNCENCYVHESHQVHSHRLRNLLDKFKKLGSLKFEALIKQISNTAIDQVNLPEIDFVEMRLSNFCNLRCLHCDHISSTQWLNFYTNQDNIDDAREAGMPIHPDVDSKNVMKFFSNHQTSNTRYLDDAIKVMSKGKVLTWSGGEPLLDPNYKKIMKTLANGDLVDKQKIDIHSNLNIKNIESYFEDWEKFQKVQMYVSLDCPPSTYNYFRRNGDWDTVLSNIKKIQNHFPVTKVPVIGHITFSMFGALRFREIADTWTEHNLIANSNLVTMGPTSVRYLPNDLKDNAIRQMEYVLANKDKKYSERMLEDTWKCLTYTKNTEKYTDLHHEVIKWFTLMDKTSHLKTLDFYPEFEMYYNNNNG